MATVRWFINKLLEMIIASACLGLQFYKESEEFDFMYWDYSIKAAFIAPVVVIVILFILNSFKKLNRIYDIAISLLFAFIFSSIGALFIEYWRSKFWEIAGAVAASTATAPISNGIGALNSFVPMGIPAPDPKPRLEALTIGIYKGSCALVGAFVFVVDAALTSKDFICCSK